MSANGVQLDYSKPTNGIISKVGFAMVKTGFDIKDFGSPATLPNGTKDNTLFFEKNSGAIMLQPDFEITDTAISGGFGYMLGTVDPTQKITFAGTAPTEITRPWKPVKKILHQTEVVGEINGTTAALAENQGMMVWWKKWQTKEDVDTDSTDVSVAMILTFNQFLDPDGVYTSGFEDSIEMVVYFNKRIHIKRIWGIQVEGEVPARYEADFQEWDVDFSKGFDTDSDFESLTFMFIDKYMVIGFNGMDNAKALRCRKFDLEADLNGRQYAVLSRAGSTFTFERAGASLIGMKKIVYKSSGSYVSDWFVPPYIPDSTTIEAVMTKGIQPTSTEIKGPFFADRVVLVESTSSTASPTGRLSWGLKLETTDTSQTPLFFSWMIKDPMIREDAHSDSFQITSMVESYIENCYANKDGSFGDRTGNIKLNALSSFQSNVFNARNYKIDCKFKLRDAGAYTTRAILFQDVHEVENPEMGQFTLNAEASTTIKRLKKTPVMNSESFDHLGWTGKDLIEFLIDELGGLTVVTVATDAQIGSLPELPVSGDSSKPNWQFNPGISVWDAVNEVRTWMGWALYPDVETGDITLKPMPISSAAADHTIEINTSAVDLRYVISDIARTRFLIIGQAGKEEPGKYKVGDKIMAYKTDISLEDTIGETRPLWLADPALSTIEMCKDLTSKLYTWYTAIHTTVSFTIDDARSYFEGGFDVYDVLSLTDTRVSDIDGKYVVLGYNFVVTPNNCKLTLEAISL